MEKFYIVKAKKLYIVLSSESRNIFMPDGSKS